MCLITNIENLVHQETCKYLGEWIEPGNILNWDRNSMEAQNTMIKDGVYNLIYLSVLQIFVLIPAREEYSLCL